MAVNLTVMDVVGRQEAAVFTWNPVEQMWVQESGGAAKPPPAPHDVHAIQTWFLDVDENEWIQTVLGPMGRQLAAQWRGAHRIPDAAIARQTKGPQKRSPLLFIVAGVVLVALIGGVAVAAPGLMNPDATPAPSNPTVVTSGNTPAPVGTPTAGPAAEQTPDPTQAPTTPVPATPRPTARPVTIPRPAGISVTLAGGTTVVYTGPLSVNRSAYLPGTFTVILANGRPASGVFTIMLGNLSQPLRTVYGSLDPAKGTIAMDVPATLPAGNWPLYFKFEGATVQIATIAVR
ncbi:MAG: hypothetical protein E6I49_01785 [Chloroflexi bacterium]|nr:MAG: hypothetical protein E6I49_01785 [Chloroflexota bacterium]